MKVQGADSNNDTEVPTRCLSLPPPAVNSHTGLAPSAVGIFSSSGDGTNIGKLDRGRACPMDPSNFFFKYVSIALLNFKVKQKNPQNFRLKFLRPLAKKLPTVL